ncbi:uncharacterized protein LOC128961202 [Oppia nitens]|uniref:uncharacterized protein LOC128961202 n=1 Tax=Oppia nitens TaxID=1686743 RepID=UPI0023D97F76|nr:uncharacterized protein LOC128961202 [Oppia nitens]
MKSWYLIIGILSLAKCLNCQYSYVYEIRHDSPKTNPKSEMFGDLSQYKHNSPAELSRPPPPSQPMPMRSHQPNSRKFNVKSPEMGSTILNLLKHQLLEKDSPTNQWQPPSPKYAPSPVNTLSYGSDTNSPIYTSQPSSQKPYDEPNLIPVYEEKHSNIPKGYPSVEHSRPSYSREEHRSYDRPVGPQMGYLQPPPPPPPASAPHAQQLNKNERQTVHQISTPNYRIKLVSEPEPLQKFMPFLHSQSHSQPLTPAYPLPPPPPHSVPNYAPPPPPYHNPHLIMSKEPIEQREPIHSRQVKQQPYILERIVESRRQEPVVHTISQGQPEEHKHMAPKSIPRPPIHETREMLPPMMHNEPQQHMPQPILEMPRQELPPQARHFNRPIAQLPPPEPHPLRHNIIQAPVPPLKYDQPIGSVSHPQALYQLSAPDLSHGRPAQMPPMPHYGRVDYKESDGESGPTTYVKELPVSVYRLDERLNKGDYRLDERPNKGDYRLDERPNKSDYRLDERPNKGNDIITLNQQIEKLNPDQQNKLFRELLAKSVDMTPNGHIEYSNSDSSSTKLVTDPGYKSPPIPDEYKPFVQTKVYKTYI